MLLGAVQQGLKVIIAEPAQDENLGTRQQCPDQLEGRVLGRRTDKDYSAVLDDRQEGILLGTVESVDFVDKEQGAVADLATLSRRIEYLAQVSDPRKDGRQRLEDEIGSLRQEPRDCRLAAPRRPPEDHRAELPARHHAADRTIGTDQMILAGDVGEPTRAQPIG